MRAGCWCRFNRLSRVGGRRWCHRCRCDSPAAVKEEGGDRSMPLCLIVSFAVARKNGRTTRTRHALALPLTHLTCSSEILSMRLIVLGRFGDARLTLLANPIASGVGHWAKKRVDGPYRSTPLAQHGLDRGGSGAAGHDSGKHRCGALLVALSTGRQKIFITPGTISCGRPGLDVGLFHQHLRCSGCHARLCVCADLRVLAPTCNRR
jgi:hypothetical protein